MNKLIRELAVRRLFTPKLAERILHEERKLSPGESDAVQAEIEKITSQLGGYQLDGSVCIDQHIEPEDLKD
jgi:hypothetical protein